MTRNKNRSQNPRLRNRKNKKKKMVKRNDVAVRLNQPGRFAPNRMFVKLKYNDTTLTRSVSSSGALNWGYRSSAYDPDPSVLTGSIPGFAELSNLYMRYRVHSMTLKLTIGNQEQENVICSIWPSNVLQNVNSLSQSDIMEYGANLRGKSFVIGPVSGASTRNSSTYAEGRSLVGPQYLTDLDYSASVSTNPVEMFYINVGVINPVNDFNYPVVVKATVIYNIEFFKLRQLET